MTGTIFCDIDGVLFMYEKYFSTTLINEKLTPTPGSAQKLMDWHRRGYRIILTTGRTEPAREITEKQLRNAGIIYDILIMGIGCGPRYLINDEDPDQDIRKAVAFSIKRDKGLENIDFS